MKTYAGLKKIVGEVTGILQLIGTW